ncbi:MAG: hypothetical protein ACQESG_08505 [Nanobdellota archaeon]
MSLKDFLDGFMHTFQQTQDALANRVEQVQHQIVAQFYQMKRNVFKSLIELMLILVSIAFILVGAVLFLDRFFSLDLVLLIAGLVVLNLTLLTGRFR